MGARRCRIALAAAIGLVLTIAGCAGSGADYALPGIKVGVVLSDPAGSARWEDVDRRVLTDALSAEGLWPDVRNSEGDVKMFVAMAESMINNGVRVLVIAAPNNEVGAMVAASAQARHVPTIDYDYDRLNAGGSSGYSVTFDPVKAGELQGRGLTVGLRGARVHGSAVIEIGGPPADPATPMLARGARDVLQPRYDTGAYRLAASRSVDNGQPAGVLFEQMLAAGGGQVDGVLAADDGIAGAVIAVLRKRGMNGKVRVTGLGATPEALKAILRGDQFMTVFTPPEQMAAATAKLAKALARNDRATADGMVSMTLPGSTAQHGIRTILIPPVSITLNTVKQVIDSRLIDSRDICDSELLLRCDQLGIPR